MDENLLGVFTDCGCHAIEQFLPKAVLVPDDEGSVSRLIAVAGEKRLRICATGTGSSFPANYSPPEDLIILLMTQMNQLLELKLLDAIVEVEPGMLAADLAQRLEGTELDFPVVFAEYPGTLGGAMLGPDTSGIRHAEFRRRLLGLDLVDPRGRLLKFGRPVIKNVAGYDYWTFLVGTDGRFGILTRLILNLEHMPPLNSTLNPKTLQDSEENSTEWIFANLCKGLDPDGIFVR